MAAMSSVAFYTLDALATRLALPRPFLHRLARERRIPCLDTGRGRLMFDEEAVRDALRKIAEERNER